MLISYMATCFGLIKAIIRPTYDTDQVKVMCAHYFYLVRFIGWPDDGFSKAKTCCHVTN